MNKYLLLIAFALFSVTFYAQTSFKEGYYINTSGERHEGLILDADWKNNPEAFEFRASGSEMTLLVGIEEVSAFEIYDIGKYIKTTVAIDMSSESMSELSETKEPEFEDRIVFLKVLAEGALDLYFYRDDNLRRYFYKTGDSAIEQLVYKSYRTADNRIVTNYAFRGQLWDACKCEGMTFDDVRGLDYTKRDLMGFVKKYHECKQAELTIYERSEKRSPLHLAIRPRLTYSSLATENSVDASNERDFDFGGQWGFGLGVELEYALPFNHDK